MLPGIPKAEELRVRFTGVRVRECRIHLDRRVKVGGCVLDVAREMTLEAQAPALESGVRRTAAGRRRESPQSRRAGDGVLIQTAPGENDEQQDDQAGDRDERATPPGQSSIASGGALYARTANCQVGR